AELQPRDGKVPANAEILVEVARVAKIERERAWRVAEGERRWRHERVAIDVGGRVRAEGFAGAVIAVDADPGREDRVVIGVARARVRQITGRANRSQRTAGPELRDPGDLPVLDDRPDDRIAAARLPLRAPWHVVDDHRIPHVRLIVDADGP